MSLYIDVDVVEQVLLIDGWHVVTEKSFAMDSYEFHWGKIVTLGGGQSGICATGFEFWEKDADGTDHLIAGPMTSVLAVRHRPVRD